MGVPVVAEDVVVVEGEACDGAVAVGEVGGERADAAAAVAVDAAHLGARDAVPLEERRREALDLDVPLAVVVDVVVGEVALAALVDEDAARLARVDPVAVHRRVAEVPHAHARLGVVGNLVALVEPARLLVDPEPAHPLVVDVVAAQRRLGVLDHLDADPVLEDVVLEQKGRRAVLHEDPVLAVVEDAVVLQQRRRLRRDGHPVPVGLVDVVVADVALAARVHPQRRDLLGPAGGAPLDPLLVRVLALALLRLEHARVLGLLAQLVGAHERVRPLDDLQPGVATAAAQRVRVRVRVRVRG